MVPNARVLLHQPGVDPVQGTITDLTIRAAEVSRARQFIETTLAAHTGRTAEQVHADIDREHHLGAAEALAYGLVDTVVPSRKLHPAR